MSEPILCVYVTTDAMLNFDVDTNGDVMYEWTIIYITESIRRNLQTLISQYEKHIKFPKATSISRSI